GSSARGLKVPGGNQHNRTDSQRARSHDKQLAAWHGSSETASACRSSARWRTRLRSVVDHTDAGNASANAPRAVRATVAPARAEQGVCLPLLTIRSPAR